VGFKHRSSGGGGYGLEMRQYNLQLTAGELSVRVLGGMPGVGNVDAVSSRRPWYGAFDTDSRWPRTRRSPAWLVRLHEVKRVTIAAGGRVLPLGFPSRLGATYRGSIRRHSLRKTSCSTWKLLSEAERCEARLVRAGVLKEATEGVVAAAALLCRVGLSASERVTCSQCSKGPCSCCTRTATTQHRLDLC
jgi:hypothetical protein